MAKIQLSESTGSFISKAGTNVLLQIKKCEYDQEFGKVEMVLANEKGETIRNNYQLMSNDGSINEPALKAFSYFTRVAMVDWEAIEVEDEDLIGQWIRADIVMNDGKEKDGKTMKFANIDKIYMISDDDSDYIADNHLNDEDEEEAPKKQTKKTTKSKATKEEPEDDEWDD